MTKKYGKLGAVDNSKLQANYDLGVKMMDKFSSSFDSNNSTEDLNKVIENGGVLKAEAVDGATSFGFVNYNQFQKAQVNSKTQSNSEIKVAEGGFDPLVNMYAYQTNIRFQSKERIFGKKYVLAGNDYNVSEAQVSDYVQQEGAVAGQNPFSTTSIAFDESENNIVLGNHADYYSEDVLSNEGIVRKNLSFGQRQVLVGRNQRQAMFLNKNLLQEMGYQLCNAQAFLDAAFNNVAVEMKIRKTQELVYNQLLNSPKFSTADPTGTDVYTTLKKALYVDATNPVYLDEQDDNQFYQSLMNFSVYVKRVRDDNVDSEIVLALDRNTIIGLQRPMNLYLNNSTGYLSNYYSDCANRLTALLKAGNSAGGKFSIVEVVGADKDEEGQTYFDLEVENKRVNYFFVKDLHKFTDLLDISTISSEGIVSGVEAIKSFNRLTKTDPISGVMLVLTNHTPVFASSMNYYNTKSVYCAKFDL